MYIHTTQDGCTAKHCTAKDRTAAYSTDRLYLIGYVALLSEWLATMAQYAIVSRRVMQQMASAVMHHRPYMLHQPVHVAVIVIDYLNQEKDSNI